MKKIIISLSIIALVSIMTGCDFNTRQVDLQNKSLCTEKGAEYFQNLKNNQPWASFTGPKYAYNKSLKTCLITYYSVEDGGEAVKVVGDMITDVLANKTLYYSIQYIVPKNLQKEQELNETSQSNCVNDEECLSNEEMQKKITELFE